MDLELIDFRRSPTEDRWRAPPFGTTVLYEHPNWWNRQLSDAPWFVQVRADGIEVPRVEFDDPGSINPIYTNVLELGTERLETQFIEVATAPGAGASERRWCER